jgi:hypothetical protein
MWEESHSFTRGMGHHYPASLIVDNSVSIEADRNTIEPLISGEPLLRMLLFRISMAGLLMSYHAKAAKKPTDCDPKVAAIGLGDVRVLGNIEMSHSQIKASPPARITR